MHEVLLAIPLGIAIGISIGALGAGGSILTIPALVLILGQDAHEAATTSLFVVGSAAAVGAIVHHRKGTVRLRSALVFAGVGVVGSLLAGYASVRTDSETFTFALAGIMLVAAVLVGRRGEPDGDGGAGAEAGATAAGAASADRALPRHALLRTLAAGTLVGVVTGFFGVGGGFLTVPALIYALGLPLTVAVGTSLVVTTLNAATALVPRIGSDLLEPGITIAFVLTSVTGSIIGARIAHRLPQRALRIGFVVLVVLTAVALALDAALK
ncbi:MAG: hypothetical protein JWM90_2770 [Thermoleophilia bacterium]|nr:hypothetical protein [Thermoleophilia bacterium]